ncbi:hypothetical protein BG845_05808 [Pseudonocardia autotrophica]|uniref:Uncharacterized protein n=1 Tax=Pseudonocardia autotrophica TaxID=2074 RepID=A0A1Y2MKQ3_PSEAH|nr:MULTISPECIES: hypothetical protein [Pseudonocardia]OSY35845.1 hypothetical protein BG845_05808 [Pseudonocardia autotrophica]
MATMREIFRPRRSASQPKKTAPIGRMTKPTANTPSEASSAAAGSAGLKIC